MLNDPTVQHLQEMKLNAMALAYTHQLEEPSIRGLSFEERFGLLVDHEWTSRQNHRQQRFIQKARLKIHATPEEIEHHAPRVFDQALVRSLTTCQWIQARHNLIITGPTGVGPVPWLPRPAATTSRCDIFESPGFFRKQSWQKGMAPIQNC